MGMYINAINGLPAPATGKVDFLLTNAPGTIILSAPPEEWRNDLVCVVDNGLFDAAGYAYDANEMEAFKYPNNRPKTWLMVPNAKNYAK